MTAGATRSILLYHVLIVLVVLEFDEHGTGQELARRRRSSPSVSNADQRTPRSGSSSLAIKASACCASVVLSTLDSALTAATRTRGSGSLSLAVHAVVSCAGGATCILCCADVVLLVTGTAIAVGAGLAATGTPMATGCAGCRGGCCDLRRGMSRLATTSSVQLVMTMDGVFRFGTTYGSITYT